MSSLSSHGSQVPSHPAVCPSVASMVAPAASADAPLAPVVGADLRVPLVDGRAVRYVNLDYAASAPCLEAVQAAVAAALPWYSSVHRGAGFASTVSSEAYAAARAAVARFVGARPGDTVVFTRHTTDALNLLAHALPPGTSVVTFASEHHANLLPWRPHHHVHLPVPASCVDAVAAADAALAALPAGPRLLAVTGASNVTGEVWPVAELCEVARRHGARVVVDAAQLAPHRAIDLAALGADYVALSGHKLYAPLGAGALVGRSDWLDAAEPYLAGGGAVRRVTDEGCEWASGAARHEAGTPNLLGAIALAAATTTLAAIGFDRVEAHEAALVEALRDGLAALPGVSLVSAWGPACPRIGVVTFTVAGFTAGLFAAALSAEHGVGVRDGAFCAHPFVERLLGGEGDAGGVPAALRASVGVGSCRGDVERLLAAVRTLIADGPRARYELDQGRWVPVDDSRPRPRWAAALGDAVAAASPCGV